MLVGIGVIGMLTSSITTYFVREDNKSDDKDTQLEKIMQKLDEIEKQNHDLKEEIQKLKQKQRQLKLPATNHGRQLIFIQN